MEQRRQSAHVYHAKHALAMNKRLRLRPLGKAREASRRGIVTDPSSSSTDTPRLCGGFRFTLPNERIEHQQRIGSAVMRLPDGCDPPTAQDADRKPVPRDGAEHCVAHALSQRPRNTIRAECEAEFCRYKSGWQIRITPSYRNFSVLRQFDDDGSVDAIRHDGPLTARALQRIASWLDPLCVDIADQIRLKI